MTSKNDWPLHFVADWSGETVCGKEWSRVRATRHLVNWDDAKLANGRRCADCHPLVEALRAQLEAKP